MICRKDGLILLESTESFPDMLHENIQACIPVNSDRRDDFIRLASGSMGFNLA